MKIHEKFDTPMVRWVAFADAELEMLKRELRIEELEAKLKKYEEPVAEFEGKYRNANSVFSDIDISCERLGIVCGYDPDLKPCKVIIIEADK